MLKKHELYMKKSSREQYFHKRYGKIILAQHRSKLNKHLYYMILRPTDTLTDTVDFQKERRDKQPLTYYSRKRFLTLGT